MSDQPQPILPADPAWRQTWAQQWRSELQQHVLPWWQQALYDPQGRQLGARSNDGRVLEAPRTAVIGTRLLWTFASAQVRLGPDAGHAQAAQRALAWLQAHLMDPLHGGVFWSVDAQGRPLQDHKQTYAQAFAIYALVAAHAAGMAAPASISPGQGQPLLQSAMALFDLLEAHAHDPHHGGYVEGCQRDWSARPASPLSSVEPPAPKSTNTLLHLVEAFTALQQASPQPRVAARLRELLALFLDRLWLPGARCFGQFFSMGFDSLTPQWSWGHDIESAWLLVRAAQVLGDPVLLARARQRSVEVADAVLAHGVAADGSMLGAGRIDGAVTDDRRHWWVQAEALVGFWDAWQNGADPRHAQAAWRLWAFIQRHHVDRNGGDWFKTLDAQGRAVDSVPKAGPWECPYHHVRAGLEMIERLAAPGPVAAGQPRVG